MQQAVTRKDALVPESTVTSRVAIARVVIGLLQGAALYFLYHAAKTNAWPATEAHLFAPLLLICVLAPVILISSLGHLGKRQIGTWILAVVIIIGAMGFYDVWRGGAGHGFWGSKNDGMHARFPSALVFLFAAAGFFIAHSLVLAGRWTNGVSPDIRLILKWHGSCSSRLNFQRYSSALSGWLCGLARRCSCW